jgi:hypothetical protein
VSYKGHAQLNNVAFMTHYDMDLHIMMESSYILYVIAYMGHYTLSCIITIIQVIVHIHDYNNLLYQN